MIKPYRLTWKQKSALFKAIGYEPTYAQIPAHQAVERIIQVDGAERGGKSSFGGADVTVDMLGWDTLYWGVLLQRGLATEKDKRKFLVAVAAQSYDETRPEMEYIIEYLHNAGIKPDTLSTPKTGKWEVGSKQLNAYAETVSLKDGPGELTGRGRAYDRIILCEAGRIAYNCFIAARGRIAETLGVILSIGTLWDDYGWQAEFSELFAGPNVFGGVRFSLPAWSNHHVYPDGFEHKCLKCGEDYLNPKGIDKHKCDRCGGEIGGKKDAEILALKASMPINEWWRRVGALIVPSPARIYPEFSFKEHVKRIDWDGEAPVDVVIDAGYFPSRYAVLAIQASLDNEGREIINIFDELWLHHHTHVDIIELCQEKPWWGQVRQVWAGHEARQHHAAESTREVWRNKTEIEFRIVDAGKVDDGIMAVRTWLVDPASGVPRLFVDPKCQGIQQEFKEYKRETDRYGKVRSDRPMKKSDDHHYDSLDALRNYVIGRFGPVEKKVVTRRYFPHRRPSLG